MALIDKFNNSGLSNLITLQDYEAVLALAEERHFARAARRLGVSQPALSSRLRRLEEELGSRLFDRSRSGVAPTEAGEAFCEAARRVIDASQEALEAVRAVASGFGLTLRLGMTQLSAHQVVVPALKRFRETHPRARVKLVEGATWSLERDVEQGSLDAAFLHPPVHAPGLAQRALARSPVVLANLSGRSGAPVISYPRAEAPVMMGTVENALNSQNGLGDGERWASAEGNTAIACLSLSAAGYGAAFVTEDLPEFGFDLSDARSADALFDLETSVAWRSLDRRPVIQSFLACCRAP